MLAIVAVGSAVAGVINMIKYLMMDVKERYHRNDFLVGAALMVADKEAEVKLVPTALELVGDEARLKQLSENIEAIAQRHSAERIVDEMVKIIERQ